MELIKEAIKKVYQIDDEFLQLYGIIRDLNLTKYERDDILEYMANLDMSLGKLEMKLEEIDNKRESE